LFLLFKYDQSENLSPSILRLSLSETHSPLNKFQLNQMDDTTECLTSILNSVCSSPNPNNCEDLKCPSHSTFSLRFMTEKICLCGEIPQIEKCWIYEFYCPCGDLEKIGNEIPIIKNEEIENNDFLELPLDSDEEMEIQQEQENSQGKKTLDEAINGMMKMFSGFLSKKTNEPPKPKAKKPISTPKFDEDVGRRCTLFEESLKKIEEENQNHCRNCSSLYPLRKVESIPLVFVLNIIWDTLSVSKEKVLIFILFYLFFFILYLQKKKKKKKNFFFFFFFFFFFLIYLKFLKMFLVQIDLKCIYNV